MIGGAPIVVSIPHFLIQEDDQITCEFNSVRVDGIYINPGQALCVSPPLSESGRVLFQITVTGRGSDFLGQSIFTSCKLNL